MNGVDWLLLLLIAAVLAGAVRRLVRNRKQGKTCCGNCAGCAGCGKGKSCGKCS